MSATNSDRIRRFPDNFSFQIAYYYTTHLISLQMYFNIIVLYRYALSKGGSKLLGRLRSPNSQQLFLMVVVVSTEYVFDSYFGVKVVTLIVSLHLKQKREWKNIAHTTQHYVFHLYSKKSTAQRRNDPKLNNGVLYLVRFLEMGRIRCILVPPRYSFFHVP